MKRVFYIIFFTIIALLIVSGCRCSKEKEPEVPQVDIKVRPIGRYTQVFNDVNKTQLVSAKKWGVPETQNRADAEKHKDKLEHIRTCDLYKVDSLTHSIPYLVPRAKELLDEIGRAFQDSLEVQGAGSYRIIVTSVLRSRDDIKKLRQVNSNASNESAHRYGTTFDITYMRFDHYNNKYPYTIPDEKLKGILAEVLLQLRKEKKCWVKYEIKQGCFHITVR